MINRSQRHIRYHLIQPSSPFFRVTMGESGKKGTLSPGMSDTLYIEFEPNEWRYYYDAVRPCLGKNVPATLQLPARAPCAKASGGNLLVPFP